MAELLVRNVNNINPTTKNPGGLYERGDVVVVKPDGWEWGRLECLPHFIVITMPGEPSEYEDLVGFGYKTEQIEDREKTKRVMTKRRTKRLMLENMEAEIEEAKTKDWLRIEKDRGLVTTKPGLLGA